MNIRNLSKFSLAIVVTLSGTMAAADEKSNHKMLERGKYLLAISGCNDCHTPGYAQSEGKVPEDQWLTGSALGYQGPWGTTYPANLRLKINELSEKQWLESAQVPRLPPMPWFSLRDMSEKDLRAIYQYVRSLGPAGEPAPAYVPPGQAVLTPYFDFTPKNLPGMAQLDN